MKSNSAQKRFTFGRFVIDRIAMKLFKDGREVPLPPQPFRLLSYLVDHAGATVTREELRQHVWGDTIVEFETGLNFAIRQIREALGDDANHQQYIKTVRGTGYRFVAAVSGSGSSSPNRLLLATTTTIAAVSLILLFTLDREPPDIAFSIRVGELSQQGVPLHPDVATSLTDVVSGRLVRQAADLGVPIGVGAPGERLAPGERFEVHPELWVRQDGPVVYGFRYVATRLLDSSQILGPAAFEQFESTELLQNSLAESARAFVANLGVAVRNRQGRPGLTPISVRAADVDNRHNSSDIQVSCAAGLDPTGISAWRIFVARADRARSVEPNSMSEDGRFVSPPVDSLCEPTRLDPSTSDIDGEQIVEGVEYVAFVVVEAGADTAMSNPSAPFTLASVPAIRTVVRSIVASGGVFQDSDHLYIGNWGPNSNSPTGSDLYRISKDDGTVELVSNQLRGFSSGVITGGQMVVTNFGAGSVDRVLPDGTTERIIGGLLAPTGLVPDGDGGFFVAQCSGSSIIRVSADGTARPYAVSPDLICPDGLTRDPDGNLYTCNFNAGTVVRVDVLGETNVIARLPGGVCSHLKYYRGGIFASANFANQVYRVSLDGRIRLVAGSGERRQIDGPALEAAFGRPNGLVVDESRAIIYVGDASALTGSQANPNAIRAIVFADEIPVN